MEDESDVFQDFGSDASDFDDDVDWNFTDGESASILQLMGEANSTKSGGTDAIPLSTAAKDHPTAPKAIDPYSAKVEEVSTSGYSDEELLDELYPESKLQVIAEVVKTAELQNDENRSRSTECEVEWALMALEEQEQLKHQSRSASPTHGDADFVSLFEEMYGGETVIALSTPSPTAQVNPHKSGLKDFASRRADEQIVVKQDDACSSTKADNSIPGNVPADLFDMLKLIYTKTTEVQQDLPTLLYAASRMLCLVDHDGKAQKFESISSLNSLTKAVCSLEELLYDQDFVNSFAPTREESLTIKWSKTIDMLPLLAKKLQYEQEREQHDQKEAESVSSVKLIAKGSERILLKNGMWAESLDERIHRLAQHRTNTEFSCALLYFGFVPDLNTPWESSASGDNDSEITLLWHSWTAFTRDDTGAPGSKLAVKVLERVLFSVILGGRTGEPSSLQTREVQMLLRMYRANYYSRKHTQLKSHQNDSKAGQKWAKECQTSQRSSSRRQRIRYSLHGKPIRNNGTPETDFLSEREQLLQEKIDEMRDAKVKQELEGCTFHPCINPVPSEVAALRSARQSSPSATVSTFERLYSDAFQRQNNVVEKYLEAKLHREELEKQESRVHPSYVNGLTIEERLENLHVALAGNALPVDFHKKIDAMRTATEIKALDEQMKERRLQPAQFKKANDGRTIVLPFQFATEIRASLSTELKQQRTKTAHRPRDHVMKGLRPPTEGKEREVPTPVHPRAKIHENVDSSDYQEADLCLDVHLSPSETHQLYLNIHDDPHEVVKRFARHFSLTNTQRHFLVQLVETRLEQFTNLQV
uniref:Uncharacterized protein n=1 Tax=Phytophthora ramorum TaxID=164328 RepID=H3GRU9_PHYRM